MPTYDYKCEVCGLTFEYRQAITESPLTVCPRCQGKVRRLISGGAGILLKGSGHNRSRRDRDGCSMEQGGRTCCGRDERCEKPPCGEKN